MKQINQSVINPNLGDLQYIDVIVSDGSGESTEVVQAVVDSGAEMCVVRQLELELEKSDRYCYLLTTKGKKAESLYKSPDFFQMTIKSFFKPFNEFPSIIFLSNIFHSFITLLLKEYLEISNLTLFLLNFNE